MERTAYRFGRFRLVPAEQALLADGVALTLRPRAFDVLLTLVERAGSLVSKDELLARAWPGLVVEENNLHVHVSALRKVLGPEAIATIPGRGYRFVLATAPDIEASPVGPFVPGSGAPRSTLPVQLTSFVGRQRELDEVAALLGRTRLLTFTGSGGVGKTRLALRLAEHVADAFRDGVWFVDLAPVSDGSLVARTAAGAFGVTDAGAPALDLVLAAHLRDREALIVVDNCELVINACVALIDVLLHRCPGIKVLATSREALRCEGEQTYRVPSLGWPDPARAHSIGEVETYEAVRLFVERARCVEASFRVTTQNVAAVATICNGVDGIPLALELAAARVKALSVAQIADRLDDRLRLLTEGSRSALPRHRTLRATIDWSYGALAAQEAALLRRASVFTGGWTLEAAEAICADDAGDARGEASLPPDRVVDVLAHLVDKSMVIAEEAAGAVRFRMLEMVRQYAREKLAEHGDDARVRTSHLAYCRALAGEAARHLQGGDQLAWLDRLEAEHDNLRAAQEWALRVPDITAALDFAGCLVYFWVTRGYLREGRQRVLDALGRDAGAAPSVARAKALLAAAELAALLGDSAAMSEQFERSITMLTGLGTAGTAELGQALARHAYALVYLDPDGAEALARQGIAASRRSGDALGLGTSLEILWYVALLRCDFPAAHSLLREIEPHFATLGDRARQSTLLGNFGFTHFFEQALARACDFFGQALDLANATGYRRGFAYATRGLGAVAIWQQDHERAGSLLHASFDASRELGDARGLTTVTMYLARLALARGRVEEARQHAEASMQTLAQAGFRFWAPLIFETAASVALACDDGARAVRLLGAAEAARIEMRAPMQPVFRAGFESSVALARARLDPASFAAAWSAGTALCVARSLESIRTARPDGLTA